MTELVSVGLDVGTTTTQLIVSRLTVQNRASGFAVPEMEISGRQVIYQSPVYFTPLASCQLVDGEGIRTLVEQAYKDAGITPADVDTGAVIITGETSRKENARAVLNALSQLAGDFVVATAGPGLESVLAAKGAGAVDYSRKTGKTVLHMDIGGGTSNLAFIRDGHITATGCMNVGGRLVKLTETGVVSYVSPVLQGLTQLQTGQHPTPGQLEELAKTLTAALEMAAGLRPVTELFETLWTQEAGQPWQPKMAEVISFSGGVADCIDEKRQPGQFGDMGPQLGQAIKNSMLCQNHYMLGRQTIRATVIGAGCHSAQLSGSTVFCADVQLPVKNLPVAVFSREELEQEDLPMQIRQRLQQCASDKVVLALCGEVRGYEALSRLAQQLAQGLQDRAVFVCTERDMAKALGQKLRLLLNRPVLCIDRVRLQPESFLDIGLPVGPALPVVVKTLVLKEDNK